MNRQTNPLGSPAVFAATVFAVGGIGFAGANLILARVLPPVEFAIFALALAITNFSMPMAPLGLDGVILRHDVRIGATLIRRMLLSGVALAGVAVLFGALFYRLSPVMLVLLAVSVIAGSAKIVAAALLQSRRQFVLSVPLVQSVNLVLLVVALLTAAIGIRSAVVPFGVMAAGLVVVSLAGWTLLAVRPSGGGSGPLPWREALAYAGANAGLLLLVQLDRLLIPFVLPLEELARYAVLAAVVGSVYRVLQLGVGHTLIPLLRQAPNAAGRRRLMRAEGALVAGISVVSSLALLYLTQPVVQLLVGPHYELPPSLVMAALVAGIGKVFGSFTRAPVIALGSGADLLRLNVLGWACVALATVAGFAGSRWGLTGVVLGVSTGWWAWALVAGLLSLRHLRKEKKGSAARSPREDDALTRAGAE